MQILSETNREFLTVGQQMIWIFYIQTTVLSERHSKNPDIKTPLVAKNE